MNYADRVFKGDYIFTGTSTEYISGAVAVKGNTILAVGDEADVAKYIGENTEVIDCTGKLVMPGFFDNHCHFTDCAQLWSPYAVKLFGTTSAQECIDRLKAFHEQFPNSERLYGFGFDVNLWGEGAALPTKDVLDEVFPDIPVYVQPSVAHYICANTKALEESGITADLEFYCGGVEKDENGEMTGVVVEIPAITPMVNNAHKLPKEIHEEITPVLMNQLISYGVTSITAVSGETDGIRTYPDYEAYQALDENLEGGLPLRINLFPGLGTDGNFEHLDELREKYNSGKLKVCGLKQFMDGVAHMFTACLDGPYGDNPDECGQLFFAPEVYNEVIAKANAHGYGVKLHAIGDLAVKCALDAFEYSRKLNPDAKVVNCIEHLDIMPMDELERMKNLGVVACMQPSYLRSNYDLRRSRYGDHRIHRLYAHKAFVDAGITLAFGTDFPCTTLNPFEAVYTAVSRSELDGTPIGINPEYAVSLGETLRAYTYGSAYAANRDHELGTLEEGKLADIIVIDGPMFGEPFANILKRSVLITMVDGDIVYKKA